MTSYIGYKFQQQDGYRILNDVLQDAMVKKAGIALAYYDEREEQEIHTFSGLTDDAMTLLVDEDDVEVLEHTETDIGMHDVRIARTIKRGDIKVESVPPEDFFVDRNARSVDDFYIIGHTTEMRIADLLAMGFNLDELSDVDGGRYSAMDDGQI